MGHKKNSWANITRWLCLCWLLVASAAVEGQQGYAIVNNQIVVDRQRHWENWNLPGHLVHIDEDGAVRSRTLRTVYNVLDDPEFKRPVLITDKDRRILNVDSTLKFDILGEPVIDTQDNLVYDYVVRPGISRVGSNQRLASNILDGDPTTFWEPDPNTALENWWVEVDLGRLVPVESLVIRFVDEEQGDPFFKYVVLMSARQRLSFSADRQISFERFVPHEGTNTQQRLFFFESETVKNGTALLDENYAPATGGVASSENTLSQSSADPAWSGKLVQTIRIVVTDTRGGRAAQIDEEAWNVLPTAERGDVIHFVRDIAGREEPVDETTYNTLAAARQGRKDFFRRELPRLAGVEVWGWGDNISLGLLEGGGTLDLDVAGKSPLNGFDGQENTRYQHNTQNPLNPGANRLTIDIGGTVWLDQVRVVGDNMRGLIMRVSSGARDAQGNLRWQTISTQQHEENVDRGFFNRLNNILSPSRKTRFLDLATLANFTGDDENRSDRFWPQFREIMLYSSGAPADAIIESDLIELPGLRTLGAVTWEVDTPPGTEIEVRTRSGDQLIQKIRWFKTDGVEVFSEEDHSKLFFTLKGPIDTSFVAGPGWSPWSQKYLSSGQLASSPSLRKFVQFQVRLKSEDRNAVPVLRELGLQLHTPVAQQLVAEVWPQQAQVGVVDTFEVWIQPRFIEQPSSLRSLGFDELRLHAEPELELALVDLALGTTAQFELDAPQQLFDQPHIEGLTDAEGAVLQVQRQADSLWIKLPEPLLSAPDDALPSIYFREVGDEDEVPTGPDGQLLTRTSYALLLPEEQGAVRYFSQTVVGLREVDQDAYEALEEEDRGPIRYFRKIAGLGNQTPFDALGDSLSQQDYNSLSSSERGWLVGQGQLVRLRLRSSVFLHGTRLDLAVRNGESDTPWQLSDGGEATDLRLTQGLTIGALGAASVLSDIVISPNPFTPNGDGVNDQTQIEFSLFKVYDARPVAAHLYTLAGQRVRSVEAAVLGGRRQLAWDGRDEAGELVPPGLYMCQLEVDTDAEDAAGQRRVHLIAVAY
jgi:hypothetical protein